MNRDKPRPFALATPCSISHAGVLAYGSTRATEMLAGAACIEVLPRSSGVNTNGLEATTLFYPGILFPAEYDSLPPHLGTLGKQVPEFKLTVSRALGLGTGSCLQPGTPRGSRRGRIVRLRHESATMFRTRFAVLLTEHVYSREKHYDVVVPIFRADRLPATEHGVLVEDRDWLRVFAEPGCRGFVAVRLIQSVWHDSHIAAETPYVIDDATLEAIEAELCDQFGLMM